MSGFGAICVPLESYPFLGAIAHLAHQLLGDSGSFVKVPSIEPDAFNFVLV